MIKNNNMKQKISIAARPSKPKDLSRNHYTTLNFGHIYPIYVEEFCNGSKVSIKPQNFSRVAPQFLPNLGRLDMKLHAFYVPYHLVWNHFENFNEGLPSWNNQGSQVYKYVPTFNDADLTFFFIHRSELSRSVTPSAQVSFDFQVLNANDTYSYYRFTPLGKYVYHVFNALGYNFSFVNYNTAVSSISSPKSCLPLFCFFKLYLDYFIPSQLQPSSSLHRLFQWLHEQTAQTFYLWYHNTGGSDTTTLKQDMMNYIFDFIEEMFYYYQNNYFTSAWMSPNAPVPGLNNIGSQSYDRPQINSIGSQGDQQANSRLNQSLYNNDESIGRINYPTVSVGNVSGIPNGISALTSDGLTFMQKFARFVKRSNFVGSRAIERILGKFGIRITDFESSLSTYLGSTSFVMNQADVTVTGSLAESGDYTGKGWFNSTDSSERIFKCNTDLYGMVFITASIETPSMFVEGVRRRNMHIQPLDFYNPDLDGSLMQAIAGSELFSRNPFVTKSLLTDNFFGLTPTHTFGYQLRYMEMKTSIDDISGDFCVPTLNKNIDQFILPRRLFDLIEIHDVIQNVDDNPDWKDYAYSPDVANGNVVTPVSVLKGDDMHQFNRIFRQTDGSADPIYAVFRFDVICNNSVMPANTSAELDGRGKEIEFEANGVHV